MRRCSKKKRGSVTTASATNITTFACWCPKTNEVTKRPNEHSNMTIPILGIMGRRHLSRRLAKHTRHMCIGGVAYQGRFRLHTHRPLRLTKKSRRTAQCQENYLKLYLRYHPKLHLVYLSAGLRRRRPRRRHHLLATDMYQPLRRLRLFW